jgi:hypothetical protein
VVLESGGGSQRPTRRDRQPIILGSLMSPQRTFTNGAGQTLRSQINPVESQRNKSGTQLPRVVAAVSAADPCWSWALMQTNDLAGSSSKSRRLRLGARYGKRFARGRLRSSHSRPTSSGVYLLRRPVVTVIGKAIYDIDHSGKNPKKNRRNYDSSLAVWEIHPVMRLAVARAQIGAGHTMR